MREKYFSVIRQSLCFVVTIGTLLAVSVAGAGADDSDRPQMVSGQVVEVDPAGSEITVSYRDSNSTSLVYMTLSVLDNAVVTGGKEAIGLEDIVVGDRVQVEFTGDPMNNPKAKRINDLDQTNW